MTTKQEIPLEPATKRTRRGPYTRQQILDVSLRLFSRRGFNRTTVRDIAREAGITDAAIYYHFESKKELLQALVEERGFLDRIENLSRIAPELPLREIVLMMARGAINVMDENRDFLRLIIMEGLGGDEAALEQYDRLLTLWEKALATVLQRYEEKGELAADSPDMLARQIIYTILMTFQDSLLQRHVPAAATPEARRDAQGAFVGDALNSLISAHLA